MNKDKIIVSVVIDKQALIDRAFDISKTPSEFNELKKVIDGKNHFARDIDEIDDEGKKENNTNLFAGIALDIILSELQIDLAPGQDHAEIVLREVGNENPYKLPAKEPLNLQVDGVITCIYAFLEKRWGTEQIEKEHTHILVNREKLVVTLVTNENDERTTQTIIGSIQLSRQFSGFHINDGKLWKPVQLGDFFRINRSFFETKEKNMELVNLLKSFSAKVQTTIKKEYSDNGSVTDNYEKAVDSNLPPSFTINIPIFKGAEPEKLSIETIAHVEGNTALLTLISADAECIIEESRDKIINAELDKIRKFCPEIPIMEV